MPPNQYNPAYSNLPAGVSDYDYDRPAEPDDVFPDDDPGDEDDDPD